MGGTAGIGIGESSTAVITNNTIVNNMHHGIATNTYGVGSVLGSAIIKNNILWGNNDDLVNLTATYSNIEDGDSGEGNISADLLFVDPTNNDYHLQITSPCIDTGINDGAPDFDFELDSRPVDGNGDGIATVDIGADETPQLLNHDIETLLILAPVSDVTDDVPTSPRVRIRNIGSNNEAGFSVVVEITQGNTQVYSDTKIVTGLAILEATDITFTEWLPQTVGSHEIKFRTQLESDENPDNDTLTGTFNVEASIFIPLIFDKYCTDFFDDFSNPASGWDIVDDDFELTEYLNGEYRVLTKQAGYFYFYLSPTWSRENYVVEVDVRWASEPAYSYGIIFGVLPDFSRYYLFDMNTDVQQFRVLRRGPSGFSEVVPITSSSVINGGISSNHLKVTRDGDKFTLEVNGTVLGTWWDGTINGPTFAGIMTSPYDDQPISDTRFDNFALMCLPSSGTAVQGRRGASSFISDSNKSIENHIVVPEANPRWSPGDDD
jgi:hypothetical protein